MFLKTNSWRQAGLLYDSSYVVPSISGVYAIGKPIDVAGLPSKIQWMYIERTNDLRRSLSEHQPMNELNIELRDWLVANLTSAEAWYTIAVPEIAKDLEIKLVSVLKPKFNRIGTLPRQAKWGQKLTLHSTQRGCIKVKKAVSSPLS